MHDFGSIYQFDFLSFGLLTAEQFSVPHTAADFDSSVPRLRTIRQSRHPCDLGHDDRRRTEFGLLPCHTQPRRPTARRSLNFVAVRCGFLDVLAAEVFSAILEGQSVSGADNAIAFDFWSYLIFFVCVSAEKPSGRCSEYRQSFAPC